MWSIAPVPVPVTSARCGRGSCFWIASAILALGPMCTTSTSPRYIQCTGKPKSGCGPERHAQHARVPVARGVDVVGRDQEVLDVRQGHALIYTARRKACTSRTRKRLTAAGRARMMDTAIGAGPREGRHRVTVAMVDAGGHLLLLERMDGGRFHTVHSATTKAVCAASNRRATGSHGAVGPGARCRPRARPRARRRAGALDRDGRRLPDHRRAANASAASASPAATGSSTSACAQRGR